MSKQSPPENLQPAGKKIDTTIVVALIALIGTIITGILTSPVILAIIQKTPMPTTVPIAKSTLQLTPTTAGTPSLTNLPPASPSLIATTSAPTSSPIYTRTSTRGFEQVIDNFENYSTYFLQENFKINRNAGNDLNLYFVGIPHVSQGTQALAFEYNIHNAPPRHYVGFDRNLPMQDWSKYSELCLWVESDGSNRNLVIQFGEHNNNFRKLNVPLSGRGGTEGCVSLKTQPSIDLRLIGYYGIYVEGPPQGQGVIYIDNVRLAP